MGGRKGGVGGRMGGRAGGGEGVSQRMMGCFGRCRVS